MPGKITLADALNKAKEISKNSGFCGRKTDC